MKVLWVINFALPEVSKSDAAQMPFGGWVGAMLNQVKSVSGLSIGLAMKAPVQSLVSKSVDGIQFYWIPIDQKNKFDVRQEDCDRVLQEFLPDILHIEGTEQAHSLRFIRSWPGKNVVSLQGIINGYEQYEYGGLKLADLLLTPSLQVIVFGLSMWANKRFIFRSRLAIEKRTLAEARNFIGRTTWDRAHSYWRNPSASYYSCNRILREPFYRECWSSDRRRQYRIFVGNGASPRKGLHFVLKAISILKDEYPRVRLQVAGAKPFPSSIKDWKKIVGYPAYVRHLVKRWGLTDHVEFLGLLAETEMARQMSLAHLFVLPSVIENSPNTLGEAMALGVPCVAAYSGGVSDMVVDGEEGLLYRVDDPLQMSYQIKRILDDPTLEARLSEAGRKRAMKTHHPQENLERLLDAYEEISGRPIDRNGDGE